MVCFFFWNVCGFNKDLKYFVVFEWVKNKEMRLNCILEIKVKEGKLEKILKKVFRDWLLIINYEDS